MNNKYKTTSRRQLTVIGIFALVLGIVPATQLLIRGIPSWEDDLEDQSILQQPMTGLLQQLLTGVMHSGNEQAVVCNNGELQYVRDIHYLTSPIQAEVASTIIDLNRQLRERDITLVVLPVPVKSQFGERDIRQNPGYATLKEKLAQENVRVFDPLPYLNTKECYLKTDTHWRPEAMELISLKLARYLTNEGLCTPGDGLFINTEETVKQRGDIYTMLKLTRPISWLGEEEVTLHPVLNERGEYWQSDPMAEILFMGDSFSNIYSLQGMGWGMSAGLAEQLSWQLQQPITAVRRNDQGSIATRQMLQQQLARGRDVLERKRVVIWEFAVRELTQGDWTPLDMQLGTAPAGNSFITLGADEKKHIQGTIVAMSAIPNPHEVTYADHVVAIHLMDIDDEGQQALVYAMAMRNRQLTPTAYLRPGDEVTMEIESWDMHEAIEGAYNRNELDNPDLMLELPVWATEIERKNN